MRPSTTRLDLLVAALFVVVGAAIWQITDAAVSYCLIGTEPDKEEFLGSSAIRDQESEVKTISAELEATRSKLVEQRFSASIDVRSLESRLAQLEKEAKKPDPAAVAEVAAIRAKLTEQRVSASAQPKDLDGSFARLQASLTFEDDALRQSRKEAETSYQRAALDFKMKKQGWIFAAASVSAVIVILLLSALIKRKLELAPNWGRTLPLASSFVLVLYSYNAFGMAGAVFMGVFCLVLLVLLN